MKIKSKFIFNLFLFFYLIFGIYISVNVGMTTDELPNHNIGILNIEAIKDILGFNDTGYSNLEKFPWHYKGPAFYYLSYIYLFIVDLFFRFDEYSESVSRVLLNHGLIFFTFFLSAIFSRKIINLLIKDRFYSNIFLIFYLFYPYLIGHGFFNNQDMPFLCAWILSTYLSIKIFLKILKSNNISFLNIFFISLSTSFLISIRILGILILLQYFITFIITSRLINESIYKILKIYFFKLFLFVLLTFSLIILFNPIFWFNPLLFFDSINQMRNIQYGVCTLTLGNCMDALNLPSSYIFIWLFFKLPLLSFIGLILFPFIEKKIFLEPKNQIILGSILLTIISIIFLFIFFNVNQYDELRHVLFLFSLILLASFSTIYFFSKKMILYISFISIFYFTIQNINMYPYQYTWFNLFGNFVDISKNFEVDYWGVSGKNIAKKINNNDQILSNMDKCIYVSPIHVVKPFIRDDFNCVKPFFSIYPKSAEKYILVKYMRNIRRENPSNCELVFTESYNLLSNKMIMGEVYICN